MIPLASVTKKAEAGRLLDPENSRLAWAVIARAYHKIIIGKPLVLGIKLRALCMLGMCCTTY